MFVTKSSRTTLVRMSSMLLIAAAFFLGAGTNASVQAGQFVAAKKKTTHKTTNYHATRKALKRRAKNSIRRLPSKRRVIKHSTRGHRGLNARLRGLLAVVGRHYGRQVIISSGCRSHRHNRRVGGAKHSLHLRCMAADIKVSGVSKASLRRYLTRLPGRGGIGTYCGRSIVHLDVGPKRAWYYGCRKRKRRSRKS